MKPLREAFITKDNINRVKTRVLYNYYKKDKLRTGDLVQLKNGDYMVFMKEKDIDFGKLKYIHSGYYTGDQFISSNTLVFNKPSFIHLQAKDLNDNLESKHVPSLSVARVVTNVLDLKQCKDPDFIYNFLKDTKNCQKYFYED